MQPIRILIVDDAVVVRSRLSKLLATDPELTVVGVAATGRIAIAKIPQTNPDVVILDVEMPEMSGLETLQIIRHNYSSLPVIMFSSLTTTGATATLDALTFGASDYVTKPSNFGGETLGEQLQVALIPKIKALATKASAPKPPPQKVDIFSQSTPISSASIDIVAIGVSTGGPNALTQLLSQLPADFPVPIVIVQHMPPTFTKLLAERLNTKCSLLVQEAVMGAVLQPGTIWLAPGDFHIQVQKMGGTAQLLLERSPPQNSCRPSVDVLFTSIAQVYQKHCLGVILTGMGQDGLRGCQDIRDLGGQIIAQDEASSVVWGMPGFVVQAGLADAVLPLDRIEAEILRRVRPISIASQLGGQPCG